MNTRAPGLGKADGYGLLRGSSPVLAFTYVMEFLANVLAGLRGWGFSLLPSFLARSQVAFSGMMVPPKMMGRFESLIHMCSPYQFIKKNGQDDNGKDEEKNKNHPRNAGSRQAEQTQGAGNEGDCQG
jgi:hypothetical protein